MKTFRHLFSALLLLCTTVASAQYRNISCFQQEYHSSGVTAWAVEEGGNALKSTRQLNITVSLDDPRQPFPNGNHLNGISLLFYGSAFVVGNQE